MNHHKFAEKFKILMLENTHLICDTFRNYTNKILHKTLEFISKYNFQVQLISIGIKFPISQFAFKPYQKCIS